MFCFVFLAGLINTLVATNRKKIKLFPSGEGSVAVRMSLLTFWFFWRGGFGGVLGGFLARFKPIRKASTERRPIVGFGSWR